MQRIGRPGDLAASGAELLEKVEILHRHFPPSIANMFALPKARNGALEWWTELQGQVTPFKDLPSHEQQRLLHTTQQRLEAIGRLVAQLQSSGQAAHAQALQSLMGQPAPENLWSVNGEPLITAWAKPAAAAAAAPPAPPAPIPPAPAAAVPAAPAVVARKRYGWWLLLLPLLLLLLGLWWMFWSGRWTWPAVTLPLAPESTTAQCVKSSSEPPEFVMVVDTSGSMGANINISAADEELLFKDRNLVEEFMYASRLQAAQQEPTRMTLAKQALDQVVAQMAPSITAQVVTFGNCGTTYHRGVFDPSQRPQLAQMLQGLRPDGATPLAQGMQHAARLVDGKNKDAIALLFVDGEDGCGENVCAVAQQLHAQQPRLRFNVVNISDKPLSNCVADITGGRVYAAKDADTLAQHLIAATKEVSSCD